MASARPTPAAPPAPFRQRQTGRQGHGVGRPAKERDHRPRCCGGTWSGSRPTHSPDFKAFDATAVTPQRGRRRVANRGRARAAATKRANQALRGARYSTVIGCSLWPKRWAYACAVTSKQPRCGVRDRCLCQLRALLDGCALLHASEHARAAPTTRRGWSATSLPASPTARSQSRRDYASLRGMGHQPLPVRPHDRQTPCQSEQAHHQHASNHSGRWDSSLKRAVMAGLKCAAVAELQNYLQGDTQRLAPQGLAIVPCQICLTNLLKRSLRAKSPSNAT